MVELFPFNYLKDLKEIVQKCVKIKQRITKGKTILTHPILGEILRRRVTPFKSRYEGS